MHITVGVVDAKVAQQRGLRHVPNEPILFKPGDVLTMEADGHPIVLATANGEMMVAHAKNIDVVDTIIETFEEQGVAPNRIGMSFQMYIPGKESEFVEKAMQAGLRYIWASCPIAEFLTFAGAPIGGQNFVMIRRND